MEGRDKIVFVTGASRGIGRSIASRLIEDGYCVAAGYNKNQELARQLEMRARNCCAVFVDVSDRESIKNAIQESETKLKGPILILINNAAISQEKPFEQITDSDWDNMMKINMRGPFIFTQEVLPGMMNNRFGRIINIVSIGGQWGGYNQVHYAASKAALINFTKSMAKLYSRYSITCNAVSPGLVDTGMAMKELSTTYGKEKVKNIPVERIATIDEISSVVAFLASQEASYITGQTINVNGGMYFG